MVVLTVIKGPDRGHRFELGGMTRVVIGRNSPDLELTDIMISRFHARLKQEPDGAWTVRDLASRNGTIVNGDRISEPVTLQPGDEINVGYTVLQFAVVADPVDEAGGQVKREKPAGERRDDSAQRDGAKPAKPVDEMVTVDDDAFAEVDSAGAADESVGTFAQALDAVPPEPEGGYEDDQGSDDEDKQLVSNSGADELLSAFPLKEDSPPVPQSAFEDTDPPLTGSPDKPKAKPAGDDANASDAIDDTEHQETIESGPILDDDDDVKAQAARDHAAALEAFHAVDDGAPGTATQVESRAVKAAKAGDEAAADFWADALQKEMDVAEREGWDFDTAQREAEEVEADADADAEEAIDPAEVNERVRKLLDDEQDRTSENDKTDYDRPAVTANDDTGQPVADTTRVNGNGNSSSKSKRKRARSKARR